MNAKLSRCCMFILCNRFVLSVNSALYLQRHANVVCYISENKANHPLLPDKGIHYPSPQRTQKWSSQMCLWRGYAPDCSDVLTRARQTSKLMNKLSIHVLSFSRDTPDPRTHRRERAYRQGSNNCKSSNIFIESKNISWISAVQIVVFLRFCRSADITNKQEGCSLTYSFPHLICREENQSSLWKLLCCNRNRF